MAETAHTESGPLILAALLLPFIFAGCGPFNDRNTSQTERQTPELPHLSAKQQMARIRADHSFRCVLPASPTLNREQEKAFVRSVAARLNLSVVFVTLPPEQIPGAIRCGNADLAIGNFSAEDAGRFALKNALPHGEKNAACCLVSPHAEEWCALLNGK